MQLDDEGGIEVHVVAERPEGVPEENWLPINREDENIDIIVLIYVPELERIPFWSTPEAEKRSD